jgi:hypothetical protein
MLQILPHFSVMPKSNLDVGQTQTWYVEQKLKLSFCFRCENFAKKIKFYGFGLEYYDT